MDGTIADVQATVPLRRVRLTVGHLPELSSGSGVTRSTHDGDRHELWTVDADALVRELVTASVGFRDLEVATASLEDAFLILTSDDSANPAPNPAASPAPMSAQEMTR
jgi:ABC-2 type transport system ATP-binding protein